MRLLVANPSRYRPLVAFLDQVTQNLAQLTWADCEAIGAELARDNKSTFCAGVRDATLDALGEVEGTPAGRLAPLIDFARRVNEDATTMTQEDVDAVRAHGWTDQTVEDVVGLVAALRVFSTMATGLGFATLPAEDFANIGQGTVGAGGYVASFDMFRAAGSSDAV
ncbi:MAG: hypothetical protein ACRBN8_04575 [Nannocystales bacterium]